MPHIKPNSRPRTRSHANYTISLMALIELADGPLDCCHIVTCVDRRMPVNDALELTKSLQWVGFEMTTLDHWAHDLDVTSSRWVFMGMEI